MSEERQHKVLMSQKTPGFCRRRFWASPPAKRHWHHHSLCTAGWDLQHGWRRCYVWLRMEFGNTSHCNKWDNGLCISCIKGFSLEIEHSLDLCLGSCVPALLSATIRIPLLSVLCFICFSICAHFLLALLAISTSSLLCGLIFSGPVSIKHCFTVMSAPGVRFSLLLRLF